MREPIAQIPNVLECSSHFDADLERLVDGAVRRDAVLRSIATIDGSTERLGAPAATWRMLVSFGIVLQNRGGCSVEDA